MRGVKSSLVFPSFLHFYISKSAHLSPNLHQLRFYGHLKFGCGAKIGVKQAKIQDLEKGPLKL